MKAKDAAGKSVLVRAPITKPIVPQKQSSKIHHGTHPYFTKRPWNVVRGYIEHFSEAGDTVLDSFGGAGVTAIEAVLINRKGIHVDINPISVFMTEALALPIAPAKLTCEYEAIARDFGLEWKNISSSKNPQPKHWYPKGVRLPKNADVQYLHEYFSPHQLAAMAYLRHRIMKVKDRDARKVLLLVFSSTLVKCNISYHNTPRTNGVAGGGDAGFLKYYRFQIPKEKYHEQNPVAVFNDKFKAILKAKLELQAYQASTGKKDLMSSLTTYRGSATNLDNIKSESVDYVFIDPPYGSKISYLDCSILWNAWLRLNVSEEDFGNEVISGGSQKKSDDEYVILLQTALTEICRVLKTGKWLSIVFASENPKFWQGIKDHCSKLGLEYVNTVFQPAQRKTVKKNQNPSTVFKGEMILNFRKTTGKINQKPVFVETSARDCVIKFATETIRANGGRASYDEILSSLVPKLWEYGLLDKVSQEIDNMNDVLSEVFEHDKMEGSWSLVKSKKLASVA